MAMRVVRIGAVIALALALGGCPSNTSTSLVSNLAPPVWNIEIRHGTIVGSPTVFLQHLYRVRSGDEIVWQIELDRNDPACSDMTPGEGRFPDALHYGQTPTCYRETIGAKVLEVGRGYQLESDDPRYNHSLHFIYFPFVVENGQVRKISEDRYRRLTGTADQRR